MTKARPILLTLLSLLITTVAFTQTVTWEMHHGQGMGIYEPPPGVSIEDILKEAVGNPQHGDPGGFQYAMIPPENHPGWQPAPVDPEDGELCFRLDRSALDGYFTALDFTYFQTTINVTDPSIPFIIRYNQVDDGVRAYVFNSDHRTGAFIEGGDARLYFTPVETDLSPLFVEGENRIVLVQFDDSQTANFLKAIVMYEGGDACDNDTEAPQIFNILPDGNQVLFSEFIQEDYTCGVEPEIELLIVDNCDPNPQLEPVVSITPNLDNDGFFDGTFTVELNYTVSDASGNISQEIYTYISGDDTEAPEISIDAPVDPNTNTALINDITNICDEYPIDANSFGLMVTDNCTDPVATSITILDEDSQPVDMITGPGDYLVTVTATDEAGNESMVSISLSLTSNPAIFSVIAGDDSFTANAGAPFTFSAADVLGNDAASDGSNLEVQSVSLSNPDDGTLVDNGDGTYTFTPSQGFSGDVQLTYIAKSEDASLYFEDNGHFYEFVPDVQITWENARAAAEAKELNGLGGYLATVTSQEENDFIQTKLQGTGWMGASDAEEEGIWKWVTGPEAGMVFWEGNGSGMVVNGLYANWATNAGSGFPAEPNNDTSAGNTGGEQYGHFRTDGTWNDWPNVVPFGFGTIEGYVVEYSGPQGCVPPNFTATGNVVITYPEALVGGGDVNALNVSVSPNPFRSETNIAFTVFENGPVRVEVRDLRGQVMHTAVYDAVSGVPHSFMLQRNNLPDGIYMISLRTASAHKTTRIVVTQ